MPNNVIYQKKCYFSTYAIEHIFVILHETKNLKPQEKRQKCATPILYEAAQNSQPEILSGKGSILCRFTEKWYKFYIYFLSVAFDRQDVRKKLVETLIIAERSALRTLRIESVRKSCQPKFINHLSLLIGV
jgi:hypothetical protein